MRIFLLPREFTGEPEFTLDKKNSHYLARVLRHQVGDMITGRDAKGSLWDLVISSIDRNSVTLSCSPSRQEDLEFRGARIRLYQSLCKGKKMDQIIRQATEIGAESIHPVISRFTVAETGSAQRFTRWETIIREALQQCGSPVITRIEQPVPLETMVNDIVDSGAFGIFFHQEQISNNSLQDIILEYRRNTSGKGAPPIAMVIGPEGGFSNTEVGLMEKAGMKSAFLKTNILRAETAAVYALAVLQTLTAD